jgi:hypothetical protein
VGNIFGPMRFRLIQVSLYFVYYLTTILPYTHLLNGSVEYIVIALDTFCVCEPPDDGRQTGQKHVV